MIDIMEAVVYTAPNEMTFFSEYKSTQIDRDDDVLLKIKSVYVALICMLFMERILAETQV